MRCITPSRDNEAAAVQVSGCQLITGCTSVNLLPTWSHFSGSHPPKQPLKKFILFYVCWPDDPELPGAVGCCTGVRHSLRGTLQGSCVHQCLPCSDHAVYHALITHVRTVALKLMMHIRNSCNCSMEVHWLSAQLHIIPEP